MMHQIHDIDYINQVFLTDNRGFLATAESNWNLAVDDPPYFSGPQKRGFYGKRISTIGVNRINYPKTENWTIPDQFYFELLRSRTTNQIIWGANYFDFGMWEPFKTPRRGKQLDQFLKDHPMGWIVWDKVNGKTSFNDYELAWTSFDRPTVIFPYMWNGMCQGKSISEGHVMRGNKKLNEKRIHTTQKPLDLYRWTFLEYAFPGQSIIDPHCGSQSSRIAAYEMGLNYTGLEIEPVYFHAGNNRVEEFVKAKKVQYPLFL